MKKLSLSATLFAALYAAISCSDPNLPESDAIPLHSAARDGDDDDDGYGEKIRCASMEVLSEKMREDPGLWERMELIEKLTQRFAERFGGFSSNTNPSAKTVQIAAVPYDGKVSIPVLVHVVYKTAQQNISDAQIQSQIDVLNRDFRKTNPDVSQTPAAFAPLASDMNIEFTLAGIDRKYSNKTSWGTNDAVKYANKGGVNAVDPSKFLNIWVCNIGSGILGYAQFPGGKAATDGVVIGPQYFGTSDVASNNFYLAAPYDKGRTATHEIGHWLNLRHIWGDARCGNDLVADTPTQRTSNAGCPVFPKVTCTNGPNGDMFMNYMDYTYDQCMYLFTEGQKVRSRALFASDGARRGFVPVQ